MVPSQLLEDGRGDLPDGEGAADHGFRMPQEKIASGA
jgi:hypothetical protein